MLAEEINTDLNTIRYVSFNKLRGSFLVEFNDGDYREITLKDLEMEDMADELLLDSVTISEQENAIEIPTRNGEIFDIDSLVLKSMISKETRYEITKQTRLTTRNVGSKISAARKARNITQKALSKLTDIDQAIISKIETGKHLPRFDTLDRIAKGLNITIAQLLKIDQSPS